MKLKQILLVSIASGILYFVFWNVLSNFSFSFVSADIGRFILLMGGSSLGFFQAISFAFLTFCVLDLYFKISEIKNQKKGFDNEVLPNHDSLVITPEEVNKIKLNIVYLEKNGVKNELNDFIKKACTQYRNENSVVETLHVLDSHISNQKEVKESALENVRYSISANMSVGFIGTLIGLSVAIGKSYLSKTDEGMEELTNYLYVAFDTTLVALVFGIIINFLYHQYIGVLDSFYANAKTYIVDRLISKIYKGG